MQSTVAHDAADLARLIDSLGFRSFRGGGGGGGGGAGGGGGREWVRLSGARGVSAAIRGAFRGAFLAFLGFLQRWALPGFGRRVFLVRQGLVTVVLHLTRDDYEITGDSSD
eukprot:COSAG02_NODE_17141_length_1025_cov_3.781857_1_plen_111_part_00